MTSKLPVLKPKRVIHALQRAGFYIHHQTGSHARLKHPHKPHISVTIPRHERHDLPKAVLRRIIQQADMTVEEFLEYL